MIQATFVTKDAAFLNLFSDIFQTKVVNNIYKMQYESLYTSVFEQFWAQLTSKNLTNRIYF